MIRSRWGGVVRCIKKLPDFLKIELFFTCCLLFAISEAGTRLQEFGDQNPEKNVDAKHEDKADCIGNFDSPDSHNCPSNRSS